MTDGILVWVQDRRGGTPLLSLKHPLTHSEAETACDLQAVNDALLSQMKLGQLEPDIVKQVGLSLADSLCIHPAIKDELKRILDNEGPIYLRLDPPAADDLPWEALHVTEKGFLAFDARWPIARIKNVRRKVKTETPFVAPLKIFALLAPTGPNVPARDEWTSLYGALKNSKLNLKLRVLVCDDDLKKEIEQAATVDNWIDCGLVTSQSDLFDQIGNFEPHIVHFFCHGKASSPPFIQAGNRIDFKRNQPGSVTLEATQLRQRADPNENIWLVTLDCCETAAAGGDNTSRSRPFASSLVLEGIPAVIGMREPLEQTIATTFCGAFYKRFLSYLRKGFLDARALKQPFPICWAKALFEARQDICTSTDATRSLSVVAGAAKDWTIPVLYTRPDLFSVTVAPDPQGTNPIDRESNGNTSPGVNLAEKLGELQQLIIQRAQLAGSGIIPQTILDQIDARIDQLKKELGA